jgi:hypothetical protein
VIQVGRLPHLRPNTSVTRICTGPIENARTGPTNRESPPAAWLEESHGDYALIKDPRKRIVGPKPVAVGRIVISPGLITTC